jgi:ubiquinone/menaquinone biosynthesis C-methylase UbiE
MARIYDAMEAGAETARFRQWRAKLWQRVHGPRVLEVGVGTGKNFPYYRPEWRITAIDLSPRMLEQAQRRAQGEQVAVDLLLGDVQALPFADASFDSIVATFVFCSVPDPVLGLRELSRVLAPGGQLVLLEHVLSHHPIIRPLMRLLNPLVVRMSGANINRDTLRNGEAAGFELLAVQDLWRDIVKFIEAERPA